MPLWTCHDSAFDLAPGPRTGTGCRAATIHLAHSGAGDLTQQCITTINLASVANGCDATRSIIARDAGVVGRSNRTTRARIVAVDARAVANLDVASRTAAIHLAVRRTSHVADVVIVAPDIAAHAGCDRAGATVRAVGLLSWLIRSDREGRTLSARASAASDTRVSSANARPSSRIAATAGSTNTASATCFTRTATGRAESTLTR